MFIYKITNIVNNKVYIGKTENNSVSKRWTSHKHKLKKGIHSNKHLQAAYNKYGKENFIYNIVTKSNKLDINETEIFYIKHYKSNDNLFGYNKSLGGEGVSGIPMPPQTRAAIRKANLGKSLSEYQKAALLKANVGKIVSQKTIEKFIKIGKERAKTEEFKTLVKTNGIESYKKVKEIFKDCNEQRKKKVFCITNNILYNSLTDASISLGVDKSNISRVANGKQIQIKGYKFIWG